VSCAYLRLEPYTTHSPYQRQKYDSVAIHQCWFICTKLRASHAIPICEQCSLRITMFPKNQMVCIPSSSEHQLKQKRRSDDPTIELTQLCSNDSSCDFTSAVGIVQSPLPIAASALTHAGGDGLPRPFPFPPISDVNICLMIEYLQSVHLSPVSFHRV
jgi:hypothetical protein